MLANEKSQSAIALKNPQYYFNRELSWVEFNYRVLHEALDPRTPLLERLKFTAIFSSNLDEFFMIRMSTLKEQTLVGNCKLTADGRTPQQQQIELHQRLQPMVAQQQQNFQGELRPKLAEIGVNLLEYFQLNRRQRIYCQTYFTEQILPQLTPLESEQHLSHISNLSFNIGAIIVNFAQSEVRFVSLEIPQTLPRFINLTAYSESVEGDRLLWNGVAIEQVVAANLAVIFPDWEIREYCFFRVTRNADFSVQEAEADDLLLAIQQQLAKRHCQGFAIRLEISSSASDLLRQTLAEHLDLPAANIYRIDGFLALGDLMTLMALSLPDHEYTPWQPVVPRRLKKIAGVAMPSEFSSQTDFFAVIRRGDLLIHRPYESFADSVELFLAQAAADADVLAIKMTLYRTYCASCDSPIIQSLIAAALGGKQVTVLVEIKARFDEETNIAWAKKLESAGVRVVYGLAGLKTHTKIVLVVREEADEIRRYIHLGTGNYNPKSAKLYTDLGLLSCKADLGKDLSDLFNFLTGYSQQHTYRKLLVAPINLRERLVELIQREIDWVRQGKKGKIIAKMNSLVDPDMIAALYEASQAGVEIDLIVRGICCLRPGLAGISDNIRVISIVGRYLEHSRIFYFQNGGEEAIFIGSADWMPRNLNRRVETVVPIENENLIAQLKFILETTLTDNRHAWNLEPDGTYLQRCPQDSEPERNCQQAFMNLAARENESASSDGWRH